MKKEELCPETVLVMQGGGSLGAYECGVYKILAKHGIEFDVVAGTSIGAINAAIIAGTENNDPAKDLEDFWLTMSERVTPSLLPDNMRSVVSSMYAAMWGNRNAFAPKWFTPSPDYFDHFTYPYLYSITPLKNTLNKCIVTIKQLIIQGEEDVKVALEKKESNV